ncbi:MAG TPA: outer membrane beta-barrel protein [Ignavibacteria bacterium]|jgi:hypothetical protein
MKKLLLVIFLFSSFTSVAQYKNRESSQMYAGLGYSLVFFTNSDVSSIYPTIDLDRSGLLSEVNGFYGIKFNNYLAVEFTPSFLFARNTQRADGNWYTQNNQHLWYIPQDASLFALTINLKAKVFPFGNNQQSLLKDFYIGTGGGMVYIKEQARNYIYSDSSYSMNYLRVQDDKNDVWAPNFTLSLGISSASNFAYGFDITYRVVPMPIKRNTPLSSSNASNYNSINLSARVLFNM